MRRACVRVLFGSGGDGDDAGAAHEGLRRVPDLPLAAVLWSGGISFGGVVAFIFADLVTIPMVLVYRRYYGWRPALVYSGYLLLTVILAALLVEYVFRWTGLAPAPVPLSSPGIGSMDYFSWDYTAILNLVILPFGAWLGWIGRRRPV